MRALIRGIEAVSLAGGLAAGVLIAAIALLMATEIFMRSVVDAPLSFSWEYSAYAMATVFFLGAAYALRAGGHVRVSLLQQMLPRWATRPLEIVVTLAGLAITSYVAWAAIRFAAMSFERGTTSFTPTKTPLYLPQSLVALGLVILAAQFVARLLRLIIREAPDPGAPPQVATDDRQASTTEL